MAEDNPFGDLYVPSAMKSELNWRSPARANVKGSGKVHRPSSYTLKDGTPLTACSARITDDWTATTAEPTCAQCLRTSTHT